ncbi:MAG: GFA family protein [Gammaproteobacteria bacterium]
MKLKGSCHCQSVTFECETHSPYPYMRCYCSICRKTAGGGGYAINIMGVADTLEVKGKQFISVYKARLTPFKKSKSKLSTGQRHFCKKCASCLWVFDPSWPDLIHPFASAIDTDLPKPPKEVCLMLDFAANWCDIPSTKKAEHFKKYPELSIEDWHKKNKLWIK